MIRVLICGSRTWRDKGAIRAALHMYHEHAPDGVLVMHGDAPGADKLAGEVAHEYGFDVETYPADWDTHGRAAGPIRNRLMLRQKPDQVIAFWDGKSRGTLDLMSEARKRFIPVFDANQHTREGTW